MGRADLEQQIAQACERFAAADPDANWWSTAGIVDLELDSAADPGHERPACLTMSRRFVDFLSECAIPGHVVHGQRAAYEHDGLIDDHYWVVGGGLAIDWTVRQFTNVLGPAAGAALACSVPLTWQADQPHPLMGYRQVTRCRDRWTAA